MNKMSVVFLFLFFSVIEVRAQEAVVIEVRKNTNLSKKDKVFKNYFINGGENLGLKPGSHVDVMRRLPMHDPIKNASVGDLRVKVGTVEIIHSEEKLSVAKLVNYDSMETRPLLDFEAVMVGDRLELSSIRAAPAAAAPVNALEGEKVALLKAQSKAEKLIREGERSLASLEMKTRAQASQNNAVARAPASKNVINDGSAKAPAGKKAVKSKRVGKTTLKKK